MERAERIMRRKDKLTLLLMKQAKATAANFLTNNQKLKDPHYTHKNLKDDMQEASRYINNAIDLARDHMEWTIVENAMMRKKLAELGIDVKAFLEKVEDDYYEEETKAAEGDLAHQTDHESEG